MGRSVFILSTGRTGTLFFTQLFGLAGDEVYSLHEPRPSYHLRILSNAHSSGVLSEKYLLPAFLTARKKVFAQLGARTYVEANNFIYGLSGALQHLSPAPIIIHLVRDPRDYIRSYLNHGAWYGKKWLATRLIPYWQPDVRYLLKGRATPLTPITRFAAVWTHINAFLRDKGRGYEHYYMFRFEDVFEPPHAGLESLIEAAGFSIQLDGQIVEGKINAARRVFAQKWQFWSVEECRAVQSICGDLMDEYGYGKEPAWREMIAAP